LLDFLAVSKEERDFIWLKKRLKVNTALPTPTAIFPRYVEPKEATDGPW